MMDTLFEIEIITEDDVCTLENKIRTALRCEGAVCTFLESLPYRKIRLAMLQRINKVITHEVDMFAYPQQFMSLRVHDAKYVTLRMVHSSNAEQGKTSTTVKRRQVDMPEMMVAAGQNVKRMRVTGHDT